MKVAAHHAVAHPKPASAEPAHATPAQAKALGKYINNELSNNDVGIDQAQTAGSDVTNQTAPRGTSPKAAQLFQKWMAAYDPRTAQQEGVRLYALNLRDISPKQPNTPVWAVQKYDETSDIMVLFDRKGEIGRGKLDDDNATYNWSVRKTA